MNKKFSFKKQYLKSWNYLKNSKNFIYLAVMIFFIFALIGFFVPVPEMISERLLELIKELLEKTQDMSALELVGFIFFNNLETSFLGMILGMLFGIFPFLVVVSNGYLLGFVSSMAVNQQGVWSLWRIFPHGIFELPAVFISTGLGIRLGMFIFQKNKMKFLKENFWSSIRVFMFVVIPLLIIAGIIEGLLISLME